MCSPFFVLFCFPQDPMKFYEARSVNQYEMGIQPLEKQLWIVIKFMRCIRNCICILLIGPLQVKSAKGI